MGQRPAPILSAREQRLEQPDSFLFACKQDRAYGAVRGSSCRAARRDQKSGGSLIFHPELRFAPLAPRRSDAMARAVVVNEVGGPEVMRVVDHDPGEPAAGEIRIRHKAVGINFADIHYRRGTAPPHAMAQLPFPFTPGLEGAGVVEAIGAGVTAFRPGDRVGYASASHTIGAYAEVRHYPADRAFKLPNDVSDVDAAALMYRGITVHGLVRSCYPVKPGDTVLLHAAAGGVGTIISQWAKHLGATVIGTISSGAKGDYARAHGCAHVIVTEREDFVAHVRDLTGGKGVDVVFDGVGSDTFLRSFECIRKYGMMVSFGQAAGMMAPLDPVLLQHQGHYLTKFSGSTYNADVAEYQRRAIDVLAAIRAGVLRRGDHMLYSLDEVAKAHRELESRRSTGSLVIQL
jgi:NADPH:quinone reductase